MKSSTIGKVCICLVALSLPAMAQRHGRPDSLQNYTKSHRPLDPLLSIHLRTQKKWLYLHLSELRKMHRTTIRAVDPVSQRESTYEGVALSDVLPGGIASYTVDVYRGRPFVLTDKLAFSTELHSQDRSLIVADAKDGKNLYTDHAFVVVSSTEGGGRKVLNSLAYVRATARP